MSEKRKSATAEGPPAKRQRKTIDIDTKLEIIMQHEEGKKVITIARSMGLAHSTIRTILKVKERVKETAKTTTGYNILMIKHREGLIHETEKLLAIWFNDQISKQRPVSLSIIQNKALSIFNTLKSRKEESCTEKFMASSGWFKNFCRRFSLHNRSVYGEADTEAAEKFTDVLDKIIEEGGYRPEQIFSIDETELFWKKMPERTYLHQEAAKKPGFKAFKDRVTLLLGGNVAGHKLKPFFIYHSPTPRALKNVKRHMLPVFYRAANKARKTLALFEDWFINCFIPAAREYCHKKYIPFKILLLLSIAPGHPQHIDDLHPDVRVLYIPRNTTSILQPMNQGAISAFKAYYFRTTFAEALAATEDGEMTLREFWKKYDILQCIKNVDIAWWEVSEKCMRGIWKRCLKRFVDDAEGFDRDANLEEINKITLDLARELRLEVEAEDVENLVNFVQGELTDEDLIELEEQRHVDELERTEKTSEGQKKFTPKGFTAKGLEKALEKMNEVMLELDAMDANNERLAKFERRMKEGLRCYRDIYEEKRKETKQSSISSYLYETPTTPSSATSCKTPTTPSLATSPLPTPGSPVPRPPAVRECNKEDPHDLGRLSKSDDEEECNTFEGFSQEENAKNRYKERVFKYLGYSAKEFETTEKESIAFHKETFCAKEGENQDDFRSYSQEGNAKIQYDKCVTKDLGYSAEEFESQKFETTEEEPIEEYFCAKEGENRDDFQSDSCVAEDTVKLSTGSVGVTPAKRPSVKLLRVTGSQGDPVTDVHALSQVDDVILPEGWKLTLPEADHHWISRALFKLSKDGKAKLAWDRVDKLWWYPPQPPLVPCQLPRPDQYFAQRLLLWMPCRLWQVRLCCPNPSCKDHQLTSVGLYPRVRQVLDIDGFYHLAAEYLGCRRCKKRLISWSGAITRQLDRGHRFRFPVLLAYQYACDLRVARMMRPQGLGNTATQLRHMLVEQHREKWSQKVVDYLTDCHTFAGSTAMNLLVMPNIRNPPPMPEVPRSLWLQTAYCNDIIMRLEEVKASVTSVFGNVLKMDSTKKVAKKIAGHRTGTRLCATYIGNEYGQVLMSVLTTSEGYGLGPMVKGVMERYRSAGVTPPHLLYVDRDCCGDKSALRDMIQEWPDIRVRLDIWHFMRRFLAGVFTDSHGLYDLFKSRLAACIFEWSSEDMERLLEAKRAELQTQRILDPSDSDVWESITRKELVLHCRRKTRGVEETTKMIDELLEAFSGEQGCDMLGFPLLDTDRIWDIWSSQRCHVACIQDPEGISLYTVTHKQQIGGVLLPVFRCARGSTSLESFHLHLNRFIPGTNASSMHFQAYLLECLVCWNEDRASAVVRTDGSSSSSSKVHHNGMLKTATNTLSSSVLGKPLNPSYGGSRQYTGELIGIEYLYSQTGGALQDCTLDPDSEESARLDACLEDEDKGYDEPGSPVKDLTVSTYGLEPLPTTQETKRKSISKETMLPTSSNNDCQLFKRLHRGASASTTKAVPSTPPDRPTAPSGCKIPTHRDSPKESVDQNNVTGHSHVEDLAHFLFSMKTQTRPLTNLQAKEIIRLWQKLDDYDRSPAHFSPRCKIRSQGRFKATESLVAPDVESTKRCFLGKKTGRAQWPDCNRYMESLISKLCAEHPSPVRKNNTTIQRWTLICRAYRGIRQKVLDNSLVMRKTRIQLIDINQATLFQWYNLKAKKQGRQIPKQEITVPPKQQEFIITLPSNATSQVNTLRILVPLPSTPTTTCATAGKGQVVSDITTQFKLPPTVSDEMQKREREAAGKISKTYVRTEEKMSCHRCGKDRTKEGHTQYHGNWFCEETSGISYEEWQDQLAQKQYAKKKYAQVENAELVYDKSLTKDLHYVAEELESEECITIKYEPVDFEEESFCAKEGENHD